MYLSGLLGIAVLICLMVIKKSEFASFEGARSSFSDYNSFAMLMINTATYL